jgi:hypothetical protein
MLKISVTVERRDGTREEFPVLPPTVIAFERWAKMGIGQAFAGDSAKFEHIYYLAWLAEKESGNVVKVFDEWLKNVADVDVLDSPKA